MPNIHAVGKVSSLGTDGGAGNVTVFIDYSASDATYDETGNGLVQVPFGTAIDVINAKILKATKDWAEGLHGWTCPPANVVFSPLQLGSAVMLLLA